MNKNQGQVQHTITSQATRVIYIILMAGVILALGSGGSTHSALAPVTTNTPAADRGAETDPVRRVLLLHSYHKGLRWSDDITTGVETILNLDDTNVDLHIEYMDTKRVADDIYFEQLLALYRYKFQPTDFDVILTADDDAFYFVMDHREELFNDVPVVFCGLNSFSEDVIQAEQGVTGVVETADHLKTLNLALTLHPNAQHLYIIVDNTTTGQVMRAQIEKALEQLSRPVEIVFLGDLSMSELEARLRELPTDSIVYIRTFNRDSLGYSFTSHEAILHVSQACRVPIYSTGSFYLGDGIVGGFLNWGYTQGETAAKLALRILDGEDPDTIPVITKSPNPPMFDYRQLERFGIPVSMLPEESIVQFRPFSIYEEYKVWIWGAILFAAVETALIVLLLVSWVIRYRMAQALQESEERYRNIFETAAVSIWQEDFTAVEATIEELKAQGITDFAAYLDDHPQFVDQAAQMIRVVDVNQATLRTFGAESKEELLGALDQVLAPETRQILRDEIIAIAEGRSYFEGETVNRTLQGETLNVLLTMALPSKPKQFDHVLVSLMDITERQKTRQALQESQERLHQITSSLREVVWLRDIVTLEVLYVNPAYEQVWGRSCQSLYDDPTSFFDAVHPADQEHLKQAIDNQYQGKWFDEEYRILQPDGSVRWIWGRTFPIMDEMGQVHRVMAVAEDITERRQAERERSQLLAQIREQARRMEDVVDTVPEGMLLLDPDERIVTANLLGKEYLAHLSDASVGDVLTHLGGHPLAELLTSPPQGLWHEITSTNGNQDGPELRFQIIARPITAGSAPGGWVLVIRDVTQQREIEQRVQQQERLAAVGQLAAGIAHDFNNIMATIVLYAQMTARMTELDPVIRERMKTVNQQAQHATRLIQQILDFSRRAVLERRPLDLSPLLKEHVKLLNRTLPESIEIKVTIGPGEHIVNADPTRVQQVVTNLALNARDAMLKGGQLDIGLKRITIRPDGPVPLSGMDKGDWICITVSDTGAGIPADVLPRIFEPFFTTKAPLGSGLGLSQVHGIVGSHGGLIDVKSRVGQGTTFFIYLPALITHETPSFPVSSSPGERPLPMGSGETILVVEDNTAARQALVDSVELLNYRALEAVHGEEALDIIEQRGAEIALVLSDVVMPEKGGIELLHILAERHISTPVVLLTGHPMNKEMDNLRAQGKCDWLPKPPSLERLAEVIAQNLGRGMPTAIQQDG